MPNARAGPQLIWVGIGAALVAAGIITFALTGTIFYGWFAYAPLAEQPWTTTMALHPGHVWGLALGFVGSVLVSGVLGYRLGLRRRP